MVLQMHVQVPAVPKAPTLRLDEASWSCFCEVFGEQRRFEDF